MTLLLGLTFFAIGNQISAVSILTGGLISVISNGYFAMKTFSHVGARSAGKIVAAIFMGEFIKLLLIACGFAGALLLIESVNVPLLFSGFVLVHITGTFAAINLPYAGSKLQTQGLRSQV